MPLLKIEVKQKHINKGHKGGSDSCPISFAVEEKLGHELKNCHVFYDEININGKAYHISRSAQRFIEKFDKDGKKAVKPFNFLIKHYNNK